MKGLRGITELGLGPLEGSWNSLDVVKDGAVVYENGTVVWAGPQSHLPEEIANSVQDWDDAQGRAVLPGFVESHTHILYAGSRAHEFGKRCAGESYEEIAASGGGIKFTAKQVAEATIDELVASSLPRALSLLNHCCLQTRCFENRFLPQTTHFFNLHC